MTRAPRRLALPLFVLALLSPSALRAQEAPDDVPAGPARVEGRIVHETRPEAAADLGVLLYALSPDGSAGLRGTRSDAQGRFVFEGVSNDPALVYLVGARAGGVPFGERFQFAAGEQEHRIELRVAEPSTDTSHLRRGAVDVRIERGCTHLRVREIHALDNSGERALFVPPDRRDSLAPLLDVELPTGAQGFESPLESENLVREGDRVRFWGPLHPGAQEVQIGYGLPLEDLERDGGLRLRFPDGAPELRVWAPEGVLEVSGDGLEAATPVEIEGQRYAGLRRAPVAPGARLALAVALGESSEAPLQTPRGEIWAELDDVALAVDEQLEVRVEEPGLPASPARPWLCIPLPPEAGSLRFSAATLRAGIARDPSGAVAVHGPLPAGVTLLSLSYRLPAGPEGATLRRRFAHALPLLHVLVADTGVYGETERMHRRRTVRSADRLFQHYEAFALEPDEGVELALRRTPARAERRWASTAFALLAALAAALFLMAPLRRGGEPARSGEPAEEEPLAVEREALRHSLADLDEDRETGKLSAEDHAALRAELRARAARLLAAERERPRPPARAAPAMLACDTCGAEARADDRFCSQCGSALATARSAS